MTSLDRIQDRPFGQVGSETKRRFLVAYCLTGRVDKSCELAGVTPQAFYTVGWRHDQVFQDAYEEAFRISADGLEDEARRRAIEGERKFKFGAGGVALLHPNHCDCGHDRVEWHIKAPAQVVDDPDALGDVVSNLPCSHPDCECEDFQGAPYYEDAKSDGLLKLLLEGAKPERYGRRIEVRGALANLDMTKLAPAQVARIAAGEHPLQVLADAAEAATGAVVEAVVVEEVEDAPEAHTDDDVSL